MNARQKFFSLPLFSKTFFFDVAGNFYVKPAAGGTKPCTSMYEQPLTPGTPFTIFTEGLSLPEKEKRLTPEDREYLHSPDIKNKKTWVLWGSL